MKATRTSICLIIVCALIGLMAMLFWPGAAEEVGAVEDCVWVVLGENCGEGSPGEAEWEKDTGNPNQGLQEMAPDPLTFFDDGSVTFLSPLDPAQHSTRDNIVVDPASGTLTFRLPLPHQVKGRATDGSQDIGVDMVYRSNHQQPFGKMGSMWTLSPFRVLAFEAILPEEQCVSEPENRRLDTIINSTATIMLHDGDRGTIAWTNRDASTGSRAFAGLPPRGLPSGNLSPAGQINAPMGAQGWELEDACEFLAQQEAPVLNPPAFADFDVAQNRSQKAEFAAPPGTPAKMYWDCNGVQIRWKDGTIDHYTRFAKNHERHIEIDPDPQSGSGGIGGGAPVPNAWAIQFLAAQVKTEFPNGDTIDYFYDSTGRLTKITDVYGRDAIRFTYVNDTNRIATVSDILTDSTGKRRTTTFTADGSDLVSDVFTTLGNETNVLWEIANTIQIDDSPAVAHQRQIPYLTLPVDLEIRRPGDPTNVPFLKATFDVEIDQNDEELASSTRSRISYLDYGGYGLLNNDVDVTAGGITYSFAAGQAMLYEYEDTGCQQPTKTIVTDLATNLVTEYEFDWQSRKLTETLKPVGMAHRTTTYDYATGAYPMVQRVTHANGRIEEYEYQADDYNLQQLSYFSIQEDPGEALPRDRFKDDNVIKRTEKRATGFTDPPYQTIVEQYEYEPFLNQVWKHTDARGNTTVHTYDYQEGPGIGTFFANWYVDSDKIEAEAWNIGDSISNGGNGDGVSSQQVGNRIRTDHATVTLGFEIEGPGGGPQDAYELYRYNDVGQLEEEVDAEGNVTEYVYYSENDPSGSQGSPGGAFTGYLERVKQDSGAAQTVYGYDVVGRTIWTQDPNGNIVYREYSILNQLSLERSGAISADGTVLNAERYIETRYEYNGAGLLTRKKLLNTDPELSLGGSDPGWVTTEYGYDMHDKVRVVARELIEPGTTGAFEWNRYFFHYDSNGNLTKESSPEYRTVSYKYDTIGQLVEKRRRMNHDCACQQPAPPPPSSQDALIIYEYDDHGKMERATVIGSQGNHGVHEMGYDGYDRRITMQSPDGSVTTHAYDRNGNITSVKKEGNPHPDYQGADKELSKVIYDYDERNRLYRVTTDTFMLDPDAGFARVDLNGGTSVADIAYDKRSLLVATRDDLGKVTETEYDDLGRKHRTTLPAVGGLSPNLQEFDYDANGNLIETRSIEWGRDSGGTPLSVTYTDQTDYDELNRAIEQRQGVGTSDEIKSTTKYSSLGHAIEAVNPGTADYPLGIGTRTYFDSLGRTRKVQYGFDHIFSTGTGLITGPNNADGFIEVQTIYDGDDNIVMQIDDSQNATISDYDGIGRKYRVEYADGSSEELTYNREGSIKSELMENASEDQLYEVTYTYDSSSRKESAAFDLASTAIALSGVTLETFKYDGLSRVVESIAYAEDAWDASRTFVTEVEKVYDSNGFVRSDVQKLTIDDAAEQTIVSDTVDLVYDGLGRRTSVTASNYDRSYIFDDLDRISIIRTGSTTLHSFEYLGSGNRLRQQVNDFNGTSMVVGTSNYDGLGRLKLIEHHGSSLQTGLSYSYDNVGNQLTELKTHTLDPGESASRKYEYDAGSRIKSFYLGQVGTWGTAVEHFGLDGVGNWLDRDGNESVLENTVNEMNEYLTDFDSKPVAYDARGNLEQYDTQTYVYDAKGRIVGAKVGLEEYTYAFDAEGRRVYGEGIDDSDDGWFFTHEAAREIQQLRIGTSDRISITYGTGTDEVLSFDVYDGTTSDAYSLQKNRIGSVVALADATGTLIERYDYTPFGEVTKVDVNGGGLIDSPMLFAGRREDKGTGLFFLRARSYLAPMGRFTSRDQIGVWGDANNWGNAYSYLGNNSFTGVDPSGNLRLPRWISGPAKAVGGAISSGASAVGGAVTGAASAAGNFAAGAVGGAVSTVTFGAVSAQGVGNALGANTQSVAFTAGSVTGSVATGVAAGYMTAGVFNAVDAAVGGMESGRNIFQGIASGNFGQTLAGVGGLALEALPGSNPAPSSTTRNATGFLPGGACFTAGTLILAPSGFVAIEEIKVGDRVATTDIVEAEWVSSIEPGSWRLVELSMPNPDGSNDVLQLKCLRSSDWLATFDVATGSWIDFWLPEKGLRGPAHVTAVLPCPVIEAGEGRVVISTVSHLNGYVLSLKLEGLDVPLEPTSRHRLYSEDRDDWFPAAELRAGERLRTAGGSVRIESIETIEGVHRVYNLEVESQHSYYVSEGLVLSHNNDNCSIGNITSSRPLDGSSMPTGQALDRSESFLGDGYKDMGNSRFVSADGNRQVRMTDSDLAKTNNHAGAPHLNFEEGKTVTKPNGKESFVPSRGKNSHVFLPEEK